MNIIVQTITQLTTQFQAVINPLNILVNTLMVIFGILAGLAIGTPEHVFQSAKEKGKSSILWIFLGSVVIKVILVVSGNG